jgi:hypothetical protein
MPDDTAPLPQLSGMTDHEPWERLTEETPQAFQAFAVYRDLGLTRSAAKVAKELGKSQTIISRWSSANSWVIRAEMWDREQDRVRLLAQVEESRRMGERHADLGVKLLDKALIKLASMSKAEAKRMSIHQLVWLVRAGSQLERRARGEPDRVLAVTGGSDGDPTPLDALTEAEIDAQLQMATREAANRLGMTLVVSEADDGGP